MLHHKGFAALSPNVNLAKQDFEVMPGPQETLLQYDVKDSETRQTSLSPLCVCVCVCVWCVCVCVCIWGCYFIFLAFAIVDTRPQCVIMSECELVQLLV